MHDWYLLLSIMVMAGVTYLLRMIPLAALHRKLTNPFLLSFLHYVPYAVLGAMTFPAAFYATGNPLTALVGVGVALVLAFFRRGLLTVAAVACGAAFLCECVLQFV